MTLVAASTACCSPTHRADGRHHRTLAHRQRQPVALLPASSARRAADARCIASDHGRLAAPVAVDELRARPRASGPRCSCPLGPRPVTLARHRRSTEAARWAWAGGGMGGWAGWAAATGDRGRGRRVAVLTGDAAAPLRRRARPPPPLARRRPADRSTPSPSPARCGMGAMGDGRRRVHHRRPDLRRRPHRHHRRRSAPSRSGRSPTPRRWTTPSTSTSGRSRCIDPQRRPRADAGLAATRSTSPPARSVTHPDPVPDFGGRTVYHCHILDHEDLGMMGVIEVT